jgi:hypothetical protein
MYNNGSKFIISICLPLLLLICIIVSVFIGAGSLSIAFAQGTFARKPVQIDNVTRFNIEKAYATLLLLFRIISMGQAFAYTYRL